MYVEYASNNSGGSWWLKDEHWYALEKAGWKVKWYKDKLDFSGLPYKDGRWLGALAKSATIYGVTLRQAVNLWECTTGLSAESVGCPCCGPPHEFTEYDDDGKYVNSGPSFRTSAYWD